jgi:ABC-type transporter Mla subunit MlaD
MALQDLTPQLRTRLSRMERAVGWFVILAAALLLFGFGYYMYHMADRKGWFLTKITYSTSISSGAGLKVGDPVKLMGFDVGEILEIVPNDPYAPFNITVVFRIKKPHYGYIWTDSTAKVVAGDLLGNRYLEVSKGKAGVPTVHETDKKEADGVLRQGYFSTKRQQFTSSLHLTNELDVLRLLNEDAKTNRFSYYTNLNAKPYYWLDPVESPAVTERLEKVVNQVEAALPGILSLTNQLTAVLSNSAKLTASLSDVAMNARPAVSNLALATAHLDQPGALGEWLLPTNINEKLDAVLGNANTNLLNLDQTLENLAGITSNLHHQVELNTNILSSVSKAVVDMDNLVQGLKHHWLLRSAFKSENTNAPKSKVSEPVRSPKGRSQ